MKYSLEELCLKITDGSHSSPKAQMDGVPMFSVKDMLEYDFDRTGCKRISAEDFALMKKNGCVPQKDDILVAKDGSYLKQIFLCKETREEAILSSIAIFRPNTAKILPEFLCYLLKSPQIYNYIASNCVSGSALPRIVLKDFKKVVMDVPSKEQQKKIVKLLLPLDKKVQLNNAINNNLQQQALSLFKAWFIDNPNKSSWAEGVFNDLIVTIHSGDWGKEAPSNSFSQQVYCIRGADIPDIKCGNRGKMPTRYILPKNFQSKKLGNGDIVIEISGGSPSQSTGRAAPIQQSLIDRYNGNMVCTNFCKAVTPKPKTSFFVYFYWQYLYDLGVFFSYENGTTGIKNLDISGFLETEQIIIPPTEMIEQFNLLCGQYFDKIAANGLESEHLSILRDNLLPKLMSGEIDVSKVDI